MQHASAHGNLDQYLTTAGQSLVVAAEPTPLDDPGERSLDHPSSGLGTKAFREELAPVHFFVFGYQQPALGGDESFDRLNGPLNELGPDAEGAV